MEKKRANDLKFKKKLQNKWINHRDYFQCRNFKRQIDPETGRGELIQVSPCPDPNLIKDCITQQEKKWWAFKKFNKQRDLYQKRLTQRRYSLLKMI
jgi:hypothetical protein